MNRSTPDGRPRVGSRIRPTNTVGPFVGPSVIRDNCARKGDSVINGSLKSAQEPHDCAGDSSSESFDYKLEPFEALALEADTGAARMHRKLPKATPQWWKGENINASREYPTR